MRTWQPADRSGKLIRIDLQGILIVRNPGTQPQINTAQVLQDVPNFVQENVRQRVLGEILTGID